MSLALYHWAIPAPSHDVNDEVFPIYQKDVTGILFDFQLSRNAQKQQNSRKLMFVVGLTCLFCEGFASAEQILWQQKG